MRINKISDVLDLQDRDEHIQKDMNPFLNGKLKFSHNSSTENINLVREINDAGGGYFGGKIDFHRATLGVLAEVLTSHIPDIGEWVFQRIQEDENEALLAASGDIGELDRRLSLVLYAASEPSSTVDTGYGQTPQATGSKPSSGEYPGSMAEGVRTYLPGEHEKDRAINGADESTDKTPCLDPSPCTRDQADRAFDKRRTRDSNPSPAAPKVSDSETGKPNKDIIYPRSVTSTPCWEPDISSSVISKTGGTKA